MPVNNLQDRRLFLKILALEVTELLTKTPLTASESALGGLKPISRNCVIYKAWLSNLATDTARAEIKPFWNNPPTCLSNAKHNKKTVSLLRHTCTCHLKLEGSGEILCLRHFLFGVSFLTDVKSKDTTEIEKRKHSLNFIVQMKANPVLLDPLNVEWQCLVYYQHHTTDGVFFSRAVWAEKR